MKHRESGLDLLRLMALFFVNGVHSFLYNGFYSQPQVGGAMWVANCLRWVCYGCIGIFLMLTGYLKSQKKLNKGYFFSLVPVLLGYVLTCVISFPIRHFLLDDRLTLAEWVEKLFTFGNYAWYVEMYIGLFMISPLVNLALDKITDPKKQWFLAASLLLVTVGYTATDWAVLPDYCGSMYPIALYTLGAVIRRTQPKVPAWLGLGVAALTALGLGYVTMKTATNGFYGGFSQGYGGFWVVVMVTGLFFAVYRIRAGERCGKVLAFLSGGVFEGYILSRLFDVWVYGTVKQWHSPEYYPLIFLCVTLPVFVTSLLAGKLVNTVSGVITRQLWKLVEKK